jgi:DNA-binding MarR family transcriptional regulator
VNRVETSAEVADLVAALSRRIRIDATRDLGPLGVTWGQVRALRTLARAGDPLRMSDLADRLAIARRSATSFVDEHVERGLVERRDDPADRRAVEVAVTARGEAVLEQLRARRRAAATALTADLSAAELTTLHDLLGRLRP